jgi:hypothetical protein
VENIGARRLYTVMERVFEELSFAAPDRGGDRVTVDAAFVERPAWARLMARADLALRALSRAPGARQRGESAPSAPGSDRSRRTSRLEHLKLGPQGRVAVHPHLPGSMARVERCWARAQRWTAPSRLHEQDPRRGGEGATCALCRCPDSTMSAPACAAPLLPLPAWRIGRLLEP